MGLLTWLTMRRCAIALTLLPVVSGQTLFFSQYQEASSGNNKYFQIYNPTDAAIDLANDYSIAMCTNGCGSGPAFESGFTFASGATISAGGTYLVCHSSMDGDTSACDETSSSTIVGFNGDDFRALISGTDYSTATAADIVDQIGLFSETDPGSYWPVCGSDSGIETRDSLLLRVTTTCAGENDGASFEDSFSGTCAWTSGSQETTPYTWTASGSCTSSGSTPALQFGQPPDAPRRSQRSRHAAWNACEHGVIESIAGASPAAAPRAGAGVRSGSKQMLQLFSAESCAPGSTCHACSRQRSKNAILLSRLLSSFAASYSSVTDCSCSVGSSEGSG